MFAKICIALGSILLGVLIEKMVEQAFEKAKVWVQKISFTKDPFFDKRKNCKFASNAILKENYVDFAFVKKEVFFDWDFLWNKYFVIVTFCERDLLSLGSFCERDLLWLGFFVKRMFCDWDFLLKRSFVYKRKKVKSIKVIHFFNKPV